jgi:HD-GYP domain-containing protein (c-di-GMP phosphodiesterase class II)
VADVFDALTSERPYKQPWSNDQAFAFLQEQAGTKFDSDCVSALLNQVAEIEHIQKCFCENSYG